MSTVVEPLQGTRDGECQKQAHDAEDRPFDRAKPSHAVAADFVLSVAQSQSRP
ncbi:MULTISPECIES: hypothetical protein [unclassified Bradyrhizobium]